MDNRTGFRKSRGPAHLADQARRALGLPTEIHSLGDIPLPVVHTAFGMAVCAVAVLLRPQVLGPPAGPALTALLAAATGIAIAVYDRLVYPPEIRAGVEATALPVAAVVAFATVLATAGDWRLRLVSAVAAALIVGGVPHLGGLRAIGREGMVARFLRDAAGVATLLPPLVVGADSAVAPAQRCGLTALAVALVTVDALRSDGTGWRESLAATGALAVALAAAALLWATPVAAGTRGAALLVLWYGLRGASGALVAGGRAAVMILGEYAAVAVVAAAAIVWASR